MSITTFSGCARPILHWTTEGLRLEESAITQLKDLSRLQCVGPHIAAMPDAHYGIGACVGSVIPTIGAVIPSAVGVDIGCGMSFVLLDYDANDLKDLPALRHSIEQSVPVGAGRGVQGNHNRVPDGSVKVWEEGLKDRYERILKKHGRIKAHYPLSQLGTLGGGNHFIEIVRVEKDFRNTDVGVWYTGPVQRLEDKVGIMLHSGSRGVGNIIGRYFIEHAAMECEVFGYKLPNKDLGYLEAGRPGFDDYIEAMTWAQDYAKANREQMMRAVIKDFTYHTNTACHSAIMSVDCHHNFTQAEVWDGRQMYITRKGAVHAPKGELVIIPGAMGVGSYIAMGIGAPEDSVQQYGRGGRNSYSFDSCSHGAGRAMSRGDAKRKFTSADVESQTAGLECRKDDGVIDELPGSYKDIDLVMRAQEDLCTPVLKLSAMICVKG